MSVRIEKILANLRNKRDLRAEMLSIAASLATNSLKGRLIVANPAINHDAVREEWNRLLPAIADDIKKRMSLEIEVRSENTAPLVSKQGCGVVALERPNYLFEVLRLLIGASLEVDGPQPELGIAAHIAGTQPGLIDTVGSSQTPVRKALSVLRDARVIQSSRWLEVTPEQISMEVLSRIGALPQTIRFRFERGSQIKSPSALLERVVPMLGASAPPAWQRMALSGVPVAQADSPNLDLLGVPRLDLLAHVDREERSLNTQFMRLLDDGLELEPNVLAPAPVVVTLVRAGTRFDRDAGLNHARCAHPCDVFLALLDMGLRDQAIQYAKSVRNLP